MNAKVKIGFPITGEPWEYVIVEPSYRDVSLYGWLSDSVDGLRPAHFVTDAKDVLSYHTSRNKSFDFYHVADHRKDIQRKPARWSRDSCKAACALALVKTESSQVFSAFQDVPILLISCNCDFNPEGKLSGGLLGPVARSPDEASDFDCLREKWASVTQQNLPVMGLVLYHSDAEKLRKALYGSERVPKAIPIRALDIESLQKQSHSWPVLVTVQKGDLAILADKIGLNGFVFEPQLKRRDSWPSELLRSFLNAVQRQRSDSAPISNFEADDWKPDNDNCRQSESPRQAVAFGPASTPPPPSEPIHPDPPQLPVPAPAEVPPEQPRTTQDEETLHGPHDEVIDPVPLRRWATIWVGILAALGLTAAASGSWWALRNRSQPPFPNPDLRPPPDLVAPSVPEPPTDLATGPESDLLTPPMPDLARSLPSLPPAKTKFQDKDGTVMVLIADETGMRKIEPFLIDYSEVTVGAYNNCVEAGRCNDLTWTIDNLVQKEMRDRCTWLQRKNSSALSLPINCITGEQAKNFCEKKDGKRLPTDFEWYFAAIGPKTQLFPGGTMLPSKEMKICWHGIDTPCAVDSARMKDDISFFGVSGMIGNIGEWTSSYPGRREQLRYIRGGNYSTMQVERLLLQRDPPDNLHRLLNATDSAQNTVGVRCAAKISRIKAMEEVE